MPALTLQDVSDLMRDFNATYQPPGVCYATPRRIKALLDRLEEYTSEVQWARNKYKALGIASIAFGPAGVGVAQLLGGGDVDVAQWRQDMATWQFRLAEYQRLVDAIPQDEWDSVEACRELYPLVTAPLLDGIWYQELPGIVLSSEEKQRISDGTRHCPSDVETCVDIKYRIPEAGDHPPGHSNPKPPDSMTPFSLGNQIIVYQDFQRENARRLLKDLKKGIDPDEWPWWLKAAIIGGAGMAVGLVGLYVYQFLPKAAPKRNPKKLSPRTRKIRAILKRFPASDKSGRGATAKVMLTGDVAKVMGVSDYTSVTIQDLSDAELDKLYNVMHPGPMEGVVNHQTARAVVRRAAQRTKDPQIKEWLRSDPEGTWETMAMGALKEGLPKGRQAGMSDDAVIDAAANFIKLQALETARRTRA